MHAHDRESARQRGTESALIEAAGKSEEKIVDKKLLNGYNTG